MLQKDIKERLCNHSRFNLKKDIKFDDHDLEYLSTLSILKNMKWFVKVITLSEGNSFGELALIHDKPRAATIRCESDVILGSINKGDYKNIIGKIEKRNMEQKI